MTRVGRAVEKGETKGFMKVVVDRDTDAILGAAILGVGGDEAIHGVIEAMAAGVTGFRLYARRGDPPHSLRACADDLRRTLAVRCAFLRSVLC